MHHNNSRKVSYKLIIFLSAIALFLCIALLIANRKNDHSYKCTTYAMGSFIEQSITAENAEYIANEAANEISNTEYDISWRKENSYIYTLNKNADLSPVKVSNDVFEVLSLCNEISEKTKGKFDTLILPLSSLWNFDELTKVVPSDNEIKKILPFINSDLISFNNSTNEVFLKNNNSGLDLGAVGKGYACEKAVQVYTKNHVESAIISVGGTIGFCGHKTNGSWNIAIKDPFQAMNGNSDKLGTISLTEGYVSTSGSYEKYFIQDNVLYSHILDPTTGYPSKNGLISVTVVAPNGTLSDILSTACFILGKDNSMNLLAEYNADAIFVGENKEIYVTNELFDKFTLEKEGYKVIKIK